MDRLRGFTLIELLIVVAIISAMMGMLSAVLGIAQRQARISNSRAIMMRVDQAIRMFRTDMRIYPWQTQRMSQALFPATPITTWSWASEPNLKPDWAATPGDADPTCWTNNLAFRLAWNPDDAERTQYTGRIQSDIDVVHNRFMFSTGQNIGAFAASSAAGAPSAGKDGSHAFRVPLSSTASTNLLYPLPTSSFILYAINQTGLGQAATRMAEETTTLRLLAGQSPIEAPVAPDAAPGYAYLPYNNAGAGGDDRRGAVLGPATTPAAQSGGWRGEYLAGALRRRTAAGDSGDIDPTGTAILDAWGNPLIYVSTMVPAATGYCPNYSAIASSLMRPIDPLMYGLGAQGRSATTVLTSDMRSTAAKTFVLEFELWSAGPDGRFDAMRQEAANRDNLSLLPYTAALQ